MFDPDRHRGFALRFATVATGDYPERIRTMHGGMALVQEAMADGYAEAGAHIADLLHSAISGQSLDWSVQWVPPWQSLHRSAGGLYFALLPPGFQAEDAAITGPVPGMRLFFFRSKGGEANCTLVETGGPVGEPTSDNPEAKRRAAAAADAAHRALLRKYAHTGFEVLSGLITTLEENHGEQPHARRYLSELQEYVLCMRKGIHTTTVIDASMRLIMLIGLALEMNIHDIFAMIEERLPASAS